MESSKINMYWYKSENIKFANNWGDSINPWLVSKISGVDLKDIVYNNISNPRLFAVGSILEHGLKNNDIIWGSGTLKSKNNNIDPNLNLKIKAVRGPLTRKVLLENGYNCPDIYGDPVLLIKDYYNPNIQVTHEWGIIPHIIELDSPVVLDLIKRYNIKLIDIRLGFTEFIDSLKSVNHIMSSSLHGLIASDIYNIPNTKINIEGFRKGSDWKYADYFASVQRTFEFGITLHKGIDLNDVIKKSHFNKEINIDLNRLKNSIDWEELKFLK